MTFGDLFRSLIGLPPRKRPIEPDTGFSGPGDSTDAFFGSRGGWQGPGRGGHFSGTFPGGNFFFGPIPPTDIYDKGEDDPTDPSNGIGGHSPFSPSGSGDATDLFRHFDDMFRNFDEVFRSMGMAEFNGFGQGGHPAIGAPPTGDRGKLSPRDAMLKEPDSHGQHDNSPAPDVVAPTPPSGGGGGLRGTKSKEPDCEAVSPGQRSPFDFIFSPPKRTPPTMPQDPLDSDLDDDVRHGDLLQILQPNKPNPFLGVRIMEPRTKQAPSNTIKSVRIYTYRSADGKTEERRTTDDGFGNRETTVTRTLDDQSHSVTTKRDGNNAGDETIIQHYQNMDANDKHQFDERWQHPPHIGSRTDNGPGRVFDLFKKGFPGFPSPKS